MIACHQPGRPGRATCGTALRPSTSSCLAASPAIVLAFEPTPPAGGPPAGAWPSGRRPERRCRPRADHAGRPRPGRVVGRYGGDASGSWSRPPSRWSLVLDWKLDTFDLSQPEGKVLAARELVPLLRSVPAASTHATPVSVCSACTWTSGSTCDDRRQPPGGRRSRSRRRRGRAAPRPGSSARPSSSPSSTPTGRQGRALGPGLVHHPGTLAAFAALTEAAAPASPGGRARGRGHRDRPPLPARPGRRGVRGRGKPGVR